MTKQAYVRDKPHLNIGTMGHVDHGKTTLDRGHHQGPGGPGDQHATCRSSRSTGRRRRPRGASPSTSRTSSTRPRPGTTRTSTCPATRDYVKNMITGAAQVDGAILVVSALDGVMPQTREHVVLARQVGVSHVVVALNKADAADEEIAELVELEIRDLLSALRVPRRRGARRAGLRAGGARRRGALGRVDPRPARRGRRLRAGTRAVRRRAVPDAGGELADHHRPRHGRHRRDRARPGAGRRPGRAHRAGRGGQVGRHRRRDVRQDDGARAGRRQRGAAAARRRPGPGAARPGAGRAGQPARAPAVHAPRCTSCPRPRAAAHAGRLGLPPAVLRPHHGRVRRAGPRRLAAAAVPAARPCQARRCRSPSRSASRSRSRPDRPSRSARAAAPSARAPSPPCSTKPAGAGLPGPAPALIEDRS